MNEVISDAWTYNALQNKCICNESGSECSYKQAGDKEVITDSGRTMHCRISAFATRVVVSVVISRQATKRS